ncbi:MAG: NfeD family protein [bacterium]
MILRYAFLHLPVLAMLLLLLVSGILLLTGSAMSLPVLILLLMLLGTVLMLVEVFIIPGFGLAGTGAVFLLATAVYLAWSRLNIAWAIGAALVSIGSIVLSIILLRKSGLTSTFVLKRQVGKPAPHAAGGGDREEGAGKNSALSPGQTGLAASDLRPAGIANFQGHRLNVLTDGTYLEKGTRVRIVRIEGNRIFVEEEQ